ncbi:MAG: NAD(P)/FAD-dependent oxidoreductase [Hyphomicrobiales bacterium]
MIQTTDMIVMGAGPAGLTAGLYGARAGLKTIVLDTKTPGGQILLTEQIFNYPGFPDGITGLELAGLFQRQAERYGCRISSRAGSARLTCGQGAHQVSTAKEHYESRVVIVATGAMPRRLNAPGEKKFSGAGISYCAVCDGNFFEGMNVVVVGGGDSALVEAAYLSRICRRVFIVHRRETFRGSEACQCLVRGCGNVSTCMGAIVKEFQGDEVLESVRLANADGSKEWDLKVSGAFIYVGHTPNTGFLPEIIEKDEDGWIITDENMQSSVPGIFAAGDVRRKMGKQISTAVGDGALAALAAERYLSMQACALPGE